MANYELLEVLESGTSGIVRFKRDIADFSHKAGQLHEELSKFVGDTECLKLVIDLRDTQYLPSSVLGALIQLHNQGTEVHLANAGESVVEVLQVTQLSRMIHSNEVDVDPWPVDVGGKEEALRIAVQGSCVTCPECLHEAHADKHFVGKRGVCGHCENEFLITTDLLQHATHVYTGCPSCRSRIRLPKDQLQQTIHCPQCDTHLDVRMII